MSLEMRKYIDGYEDKYSVTSWGRVINNYEGRELPYNMTEKGYLRVDLYKNGKRKHFKVHRLVAAAFIENPDNKPQINHIDGNKRNNSVTNLEWCTDEENKTHRLKLLEESMRIAECTA